MSALLEFAQSISIERCFKITVSTYNDRKLNITLKILQINRFEKKIS